MFCRLVKLLGTSITLKTTENLRLLMVLSRTLILLLNIPLFTSNLKWEKKLEIENVYSLIIILPLTG